MQQIMACIALVDKCANGQDQKDKGSEDAEEGAAGKKHSTGVKRAGASSLTGPAVARD